MIFNGRFASIIGTGGGGGGGDGGGGDADGGGRVHTRKNSCRGKLSEDQSGGAAAVTSDYDGFGRISEIPTRILKRESPELQVNTLTPRPKGDLA